MQMVIFFFSLEALNERHQPTVLVEAADSWCSRNTKEVRHYGDHSGVERDQRNISFETSRNLGCMSNE